MDHELQTPDMTLRPVVYSGIYLNVPGGDDLCFNKKLISAVEDIGAQYGTVSGSNLKKGIHYIKANTNCPSTRQIKMMLRNVENSVIAAADDTTYIYRCSIKYFVEVFSFIVEKAGIAKPDGALYSDFLIPDTLRGIDYVVQHPSNELIQGIARNMYRDLSF